MFNFLWWFEKGIIFYCLENCVKPGKHVALSNMLQQTFQKVISKPKAILQPTRSSEKDLVMQKKVDFFCRKSLHDCRSDER